MTDRNRDDNPCPDGECKHSYDERPAASVTLCDREFDQCSVCGWTADEIEDLGKATPADVAAQREVARLRKEVDAHASGQAALRNLLAHALRGLGDPPVTLADCAARVADIFPAVLRSLRELSSMLEREGGYRTTDQQAAMARARRTLTGDAS